MRPGSPARNNNRPLPAIREEAADAEELKGGDQDDPEDLDGIDEELLNTEKPAYFDEYDETWVDSEDEMVAGENNYIQIECLPLDGEPVPEE